MQGAYIWTIKELHERYGLIIRVSPNALHVNDPDFYDAAAEQGRSEISMPGS